MNSIIIDTIIFLVFCIFLLIIFLSIKKYKKLYKYKTKILKMQLSELLDEKIFTASDGNRFIVYKTNFNNKNKYIYLFLHDIYGLNEFIINFIKNNNSENIMTFIQRGFLDDNVYDKNFSYTLGITKQMVEYIKAKYPQSKIVLVCEGFSCLFINKLFIEKNIEQFILINPLLDIKHIDLSWIQKLKFHFPYLCKLNKKINLNVNYAMLTNNEKLINNKKQTSLTMNYLYLYQCLHLIKKFKISHQKNVSILQAQYSVFYNELKLIKNIKNIKQVILLDSTSQLLSSTNHVEQIFQILE